MLAPLENAPSKPAIELTKINAAAMPEITLGCSARKNNSRGLKNMPPPTPETPDKKPSKTPVINR